MSAVLEVRWTGPRAPLLFIRSSVLQRHFVWIQAPGRMGVPSRDHPLAPKGGSGVGHPRPQPAPTPLGPPGGGGSVRHVRRLAGPRRPKEAVKRETDCRVQGDPGHPPDAGHVARAQHGDPAARGGPGLGIANVQLWNPEVARGGPVVPGDRGAAQRRGTPDQARPAVERDPGAAGPGPDRDRLTLDDTLMNQY